MKAKISIIALKHPEFDNLFLHGLRRDSNRWSLPGGYANNGETAKETAIRELKEETGIDLKEIEECRNGCFNNSDITLFIGTCPTIDISPIDDPDSEFSEFKFIDPRFVNEKTMHVPNKRNILLLFLKDKKNNEIEKQEPLIKMPLVFSGTKKKPYKTVIRVQSKEGAGPYTDPDIEGFEEHGDISTEVGRRTPPPTSDPGFTKEDLKRLSSVSEPPVKFGFYDKKQLKRWFTEDELKRLASHGYKPEKIKASKIWSSGSQVFFEKYKSKLKKNFILESIIKTDEDYKKEAFSRSTLLIPVSIRGKKELMKEIPYHVTVKTFGKIGEIDKNDIKNRIKPHEDLLKVPIDSSKITLTPSTFTSQKGNKYHVLILNGFPSHFKDIYDRNRDVGIVYKDFLPHITVDKETWDKVKDGDLASDHGIVFHAPELHIGNVLEKVYY